jgi:hypothetical protein
MDAFSTAGPAGDAVAALALVRALIRKLHEAGKLYLVRYWRAELGAAKTN